MTTRRQMTWCCIQTLCWLLYAVTSHMTDLGELPSEECLGLARVKEGNNHRVPHPGLARRLDGIRYQHLWGWSFEDHIMLAPTGTGATPADFHGLPVNSASLTSRSGVAGVTMRTEWSFTATTGQLLYAAPCHLMYCRKLNGCTAEKLCMAFVCNTKSFAGLPVRHSPLGRAWRG
jgi:hypothetical protein